MLHIVRIAAPSGANQSDIMEHFRTLPETGFLRLPQVLQFIPVSRSAWWAGVKSGRYPKSVKISAHITAWRAEDIRILIQAVGDTK
jgi:prophage regulatory protein